MKFMKRLIIPVVSFLVAFQLFSLALPSLTFAQATPSPYPTGPWWNQTSKQFKERVQQAPESEIFGERYTFAQINWIINSLFLILDPTEGLGPQDILDTIKGIREKIGSRIVPTQELASLGAPGIISSSLMDIYVHPPASGRDTITTTLAKYNLVQPAHAQGYGFSSTNAIQKLWAASRNMAFLLIILLLIVAGFMIMFRVKINPQTVITVQLMIPRLIITLIAITFSYAIAGLAIDLVYLLLGFIISIFAATGAIGQGTTPLEIFRWFATPDYFRVAGTFLIPPLYIATLGGVTSLFSWLPLLGPLFQGLNTLIVIITLIYYAFVIWLLVKVWWMMVKTYLMLMVTIIIGPWQIMLGLLNGDPRSNMGFGGWVRSLLGHTSVFLVVPLMYMLVIFFWTGIFPQSFLIWQIDPLGDPTVIGSGDFPAFPLLGTKGGVFSFVMGYALFALIPKVADMVRDAIKAPQFKYGTAFGEAMGGAAAGWGVYNTLGGTGRKVELEAAQRAATMPGATDAQIRAYRQALSEQQWRDRISSMLNNAKKGI